MGVAGSLASVLCDSCFHVVDTVNIRAKASKENLSSLQVTKQIYRAEGIMGFAKGFSACFYSAAFCGFIYFAAYKYLKGVYKERWVSQVTYSEDGDDTI